MKKKKNNNNNKKKITIIIIIIKKTNDNLPMVKFLFCNSMTLKHDTFCKGISFIHGFAFGLLIRMEFQITN